MLRQAHRAMSTCSLAGIFPPIPTAFCSKRGGDVALDRLEENISKWNKHPFAGYVVLGSNGEAPLLSSDEKVAVVTATANNANGKTIIVGTGCESTRATVELNERIAAVRGVNALLVTTPWFYKSNMSNEALKQHFTAVADAAKLPVVLYNVPANTGVDMDASLIVELAQHPNIIGLKDSSGNVPKIAQVVHLTKSSGFQVMAGSAGFLLPAIHAGAVGGVLGVANVLGAECCELYRLAIQRSEEAVELQARLIEPNTMVTRRFGVPGLKAMLDDRGMFGGLPRSPLVKLSEENVKIIRDSFSKYGFA